ncbi:metal ABC transporter ATP-binding protein [Desulfovibrio sp. JC022]|uniref:metal ABC transporter ATP-binding protein n=1 Tax=Desulfovibrio sp. JC022 TaxID=2593642 RepID=UPI0013D30BC1|nr:metal ABC transporter ATP-binding protein [Desulfovibrio sp. JC022]NDV24877.1 metal ABC transporter ATP-binding protein [Desulfovibrio sp. JC022]
MQSEITLEKGPSINFENVGLRLGGNLILDKVAFTVQSGSIHCIIGPNGGGKTSLLRCLLGQMPHSGEITVCWNGKAVVGYVPQSLDFDDTLPMTVVDFMTMVGQKTRPAFLGMKKDRSREVRLALKRVGMEAKMERPFGSLSGGERQRVLLAQSLMPDPKLLILDEPATGLDKSGAAIMHGIIEDLAAAGTTVLIIHHDLAVVRDMAHGVTCINRNVLFSGDPQQELTAERIFTVFSSN